MRILEVNSREQWRHERTPLYALDISLIAIKIERKILKAVVFYRINEGLWHQILIKYLYPTADTADEETIDSSEVQVWLDMSNQQIGLMLNRDIQFSYRDFAKVTFWDWFYSVCFFMMSCLKLTVLMFYENIMLYGFLKCVKLYIVLMFFFQWNGSSTPNLRRYLDIIDIIICNQILDCG